MCANPPLVVASEIAEEARSTGVVASDKALANANGHAWWQRIAGRYRTQNGHAKKYKVFLADLLRDAHAAEFGDRTNVH